jgi:uncharacterized protein (TIGR03435 family)
VFQPKYNGPEEGIPFVKKLVLFVIAWAAFTGNALFAQKDADITGVWQGTLNVGQELRIMFKISKDDGALKAVMYSIDQTPTPIATTITVQGPNVKVSIPAAAGAYEGKLDSDGSVIAGTWSQGGKPLPLNLKHVTGDEIWAIPEAPARLKPMPKDANPVFEVATIKPSKPGAPGKALTIRGRQFVTVNTSMNDLITFAYGINVQQIAGAPKWFDSDQYDILAEPEGDGVPNRKQLETLVQKLLADRFKLAFHREKKDLMAFVIAVGKSGPKMTKSAGDPNGLPGLGFRQMGSMFAANAGMTDFAGLLQSFVLDRPVVDQTGLTGRFDFELKWTPDESQFGGRGGGVKHDEADAPPNLFTALQEQLGLQLKSEKTPVDVLVIDKVEKPSAN